MNEVAGHLELSALNSEIAEAYLKDAEDELSTVVDKLEDCLRLITKLRHQSVITEYSFNES
ncbi:hypothetical protein ACFLXF_03205 [Chloroflexota bacterium]